MSCHREKKKERHKNKRKKKKISHPIDTHKSTYLPGEFTTSLLVPGLDDTIYKNGTESLASFISQDGFGVQYNIQSLGELKVRVSKHLNLIANSMSLSPGS